MSLRILGISRAERFSPNSVDRDAAIFRQVVACLTAEHVEVACVDEDHFVTAKGYSAVFSMARDERVLRLLAAEESQGLPVINSASSLLKFTREALTSLFEQEQIPVPSSPVLFRLEGQHMKAYFRFRQQQPLQFPLWLKRSGACAQSAGDVCFVENAEALSSALCRYAEQGIDEVLASEHLQGDLIKFYGVEGTDFFYTYYPTADNAFSKFGLEKINGAPSGYPLDREALKRQADRAAHFCAIPVYGGDAIVDAQGNFRIIDFNDWPSYSRCCAEAASAIAKKLLQQFPMR